MRSLLLCGILIASPTALRAQDVEISTASLQTPAEQVGSRRPASWPCPFRFPIRPSAAGWAWSAWRSTNRAARLDLDQRGRRLYTDSKSWAVAAFKKAYLGGDKYRVTAGVGTGVFNVDFFGIGSDAGCGRATRSNWSRRPAARSSRCWHGRDSTSTPVCATATSRWTRRSTRRASCRSSTFPTSSCKARSRSWAPPPNTTAATASTIPGPEPTPTPSGWSRPTPWAATSTIRASPRR